jgi:hypothetical protein
MNSIGGSCHIELTGGQAICGIPRIGYVVPYDFVKVHLLAAARSAGRLFAWDVGWIAQVHDLMAGLPFVSGKYEGPDPMISLICSSAGVVAIRAGIMNGARSPARASNIPEGLGKLALEAGALPHASVKWSIIVCACAISQLLKRSTSVWLILVRPSWRATHDVRRVDESGDGHKVSRPLMLR